MGKTTGEFGIIVSPDGRMMACPSGRKPPLGWRFTGSTGTKAEMQAAIRQQFVSTVPAIPTLHDEVALHPADTQWASTLIEE